MSEPPITQTIPHRDSVVSLREVTRDIASAKVVEEYPGSRYIDYISLVRINGRWVELPVVGVFEVGSSGQFSSAVFYYDSAKAKALANLAK